MLPRGAKHLRRVGVDRERLRSRRQVLRRIVIWTPVRAHACSSSHACLPLSARAVEERNVLRGKRIDERALDLKHVRIGKECEQHHDWETSLRGAVPRSTRNALGRNTSRGPAFCNAAMAQDWPSRNTDPSRNAVSWVYQQVEESRAVRCAKRRRSVGPKDPHSSSTRNASRSGSRLGQAAGRWNRAA